MLNFIYTLSLRVKITLAALISIIIISSTLTMLASDKLWQQTRSGIYSRAISVSDTAIPSFEFWLEKHKEILLSSANVNKLYQAQGNMIQAKRSGGFIDVYYAKTNGSLFIAERIGRLANFDARTREWYQLALNNTGVSLSEPYVGEENGLTMVTLSTPIVINGEIVAVMGADISLESLQHTINRYQVGKNAYAMMFNANDLILSHPDANQLMSSFNRLFPSLSPTEVQSSIKEEGIQIVENGDTESLAYFKTVPNTNWIFAVIMDRKTEEGHHQELLQQLITMSVILTIVFIVIIAGFITYLMRDFYRVSKALEDIAQGDGDLTRTIESASRDEIGRLATNFNTFVRNMHTMIGNIHSLAENLNQQADITAQQAQERSVRIQSQQNEINMVAAAVTEMSTATQEIASNAENTAQEGDITVSISEKGCQEVQRSQQSILKLASDIQNSTEVIKQLELHTQDISSILSSIQGIAEQTNLLALNAAIEAARAGEQGRGFAVVADEVRILSQRTHDSTNEIQQTIETLQSTTKTAVESMDSSQVGAENSVTDANTASKSLDLIIQSVNRINDMATHIATAAEEQSLVTEEITRNTQAVNDVSFELATEAQEASKQAELLSNYSQQLHNEVSQFKL